MFFEIIKKYRNDILLILALILVSASTWLILDTTKTSGSTVVVFKDNTEYAQYDLNKDAEIMIKDGDEYNKLIIKDGSVKVVEASCPKQMCVNSSAISYNNETITCLHNKVVVKVISDIDPEVDFIS
ncbi:MAG: NusG domain II-containing protein [Clostridia bacterium]|nr:NusG domain II-containing protein [Clostridia bacterium]